MNTEIDNTIFSEIMIVVAAVAEKLEDLYKQPMKTAQFQGIEYAIEEPGWLKAAHIVELFFNDTRFMACDAFEAIVIKLESRASLTANAANRLLSDPRATQAADQEGIDSNQLTHDVERYEYLAGVLLQLINSRK